ncbi:four helix bundle protein [bacterium]|nr:four helix bundle protein [bacterium]
MATTKFRFDFERLETYQQAFRLNREIFKISLKFRRLLQSSLGDQLRRASLSILTNLAEGSGQDSRPQKKRHYKYAYNSARECIPILATACSLEIVSAELHQKLRDDFTGVIKMLAKLVKSVDKNSKAGVKK